MQMYPPTPFYIPCRHFPSPQNHHRRLHTRNQYRTSRLHIHSINPQRILRLKIALHTISSIGDDVALDLIFLAAGIVVDGVVLGGAVVCVDGCSDCEVWDRG